MELTVWGWIVFAVVMCVGALACGRWHRMRCVMEDLNRWEAVRGTPADRHFPD